MNLHEYIYGCVLFLGVAFVYYIFHRKHSTEPFQSAPRIAIITSIYGGYDSLKDPQIKMMDMVDWFCFTDSTSMHSNVWRVINTPYHLKNRRDEYVKYHNYYDNIIDAKTRNMMSAKYYKAKPHDIDILQPYDFYIWVDGSITLRPNFLVNMIRHINAGHDLINFKHSARDNIRDEAAHSIEMNKYSTQDIMGQYDAYIEEGFPDNIGLFECTIMGKKNRPEINYIFDTWWMENLKHTYQDQISYPYSLWKNGKYDQYIIKQNVFNNREYSHAVVLKIGGEASFHNVVT